MAQSSVLFRNETGSVVVLDLPRSIEEGQRLSAGLGAENAPDETTPAAARRHRRLLSSPAPSKPFPVPEPRKGGTSALLTPAAQLAELTALAAAGGALDTIAASAFDGPWHLPRCVSRPVDRDGTQSAGKSVGCLKRRRSETGQDKGDTLAETAGCHIPPRSQFLLGTIDSQRSRFLTEVPGLDLVVLDPPWPNRSARRKKQGNSYAVADNVDAIRALLAHIPLAAKLKPDGLVAVWVTNSSAMLDVLTCRRHGVFALWGVELLDTWTWLKVCASGQPIFDLESQWRKPWERLVIARRIGSQKRLKCPPGRVIVTVPDVHSRKPCLRALLEESMRPGYSALEVFARNLTAGWWSWGDEVLRFQAEDHWVEHDEAEVEAEIATQSAVPMSLEQIEKDTPS